MTSEFMEKMFPEGRRLTRVRLGAPHPELVRPELEPEEIEMLKVYSRWADGLAILPDRLILVEAKIRPQMGPLEALHVYAELLKTTEDFKEFWKLPIEKWYVYAIEDPLLSRLARLQGIRAVNFKPSWLPDYLKLLSPRERRAPLTSWPGAR